MRFILINNLLDLNLVNAFEIEPTLLDMLISLSFRMMIPLVFLSLPKRLSASKDMPLVMDASPTTATPSPSSFFKCFAYKTPNNADNAVPACPLSHWS